MSNFSTDADLVKWEPDVFRLARIPAQKLISSSTGVTAAGSAVVTDGSANYLAAGVQAGHVAHLQRTGVYDVYLPVASVVSATELTLDAPAGIFVTQDLVTVEVHTFDAQHEEAHFELCQRFGITGEGEVEFAEDELHEVRVLRRASAFRVLQMIFRAGASDAGDLFWQKAQVYGELYGTALESARVRFDVNGDGTPDAMRSGHSVRLGVEEEGDNWPVERSSER